MTEIKNRYFSVIVNLHHYDLCYSFAWNKPYGNNHENIYQDSEHRVDSNDCTNVGCHWQHNKQYCHC